MARFPYHQRNIRDLGRLIAKAAEHPDYFSQLQNNPRQELSTLGLPEKTTALINFKVVREGPNRKSICLPFRVDNARIQSADPTYLATIDSTFRQVQAPHS